MPKRQRSAAGSAPAVAAEPDAELEVEAILETRAGLKGAEFRVAWLNFNDPEDDSWEPRSSLKHLTAFKDFMEHGPANVYAHCV